MTLTTSETLRAWILSALVVHGAVAGNPDAKRLYDDLLSNYNKLVRPVVNTSDVLKVCIKLKLSQLIDVVSKIAFTHHSPHFIFFMLTLRHAAQQQSIPSHIIHFCAMRHVNRIKFLKPNGLYS